MSQGSARCFWRSTWLASGLCGLLLAPESQAGDLPPPPTSLEAVTDAQLYLELVVNQLNTGQVVPVQQRAGHFLVPVSVLRASGMKLPETLPDEIDLDSLPGLHSEYDSQGQRLLLNVPAN